MPSKSYPQLVSGAQTKIGDQGVFPEALLIDICFLFVCFYKITLGKVDQRKDGDNYSRQSKQLV